MRLSALLLLSLVSLSAAGEPCVPRDFGHSSTVCVCNSTYCDTYDAVQGKYLSVQSASLSVLL